MQLFLLMFKLSQLWLVGTSLSCLQSPSEVTLTVTDNFLATKILWGFPGGAVVKNPPANAGDTGSSPGLGRSHMPRSI